MILKKLVNRFFLMSFSFSYLLILEGKSVRQNVRTSLTRSYLYIYCNLQHLVAYFIRHISKVKYNFMLLIHKLLKYD